MKDLRLIKKLYLLGAVMLLLPAQASAAIYISEVAWMGNNVSANHEWIELYNDGSATDVSGWVLTDGMNLTVDLEGMVPADSYVVAERTSDASALGAAFFIYTGALVNTGATLRLLRADGSLVDQVVGGDGWGNIGGDNITKETAQYTTGGWVTAAATPSESLVWSDDNSVGGDKEDYETITTTVAKSPSSGGEPLILTEPDITLELAIQALAIGYVNQPISFVVEPTGVGKTLINSLLYKWNFGDGFNSTSKESTHIFRYPGTYVVTVYAGFKRQEQVTRQEITILPVKASLSTNSSGDVQVNNDSPYEINISGYRLRGEESFVFPDYSILLPNQTITIPKNKLGETKNRMVALYDTESTIVSSIVPDKLKEEQNTVVNETVSISNSHNQYVGSASSGFSFNNNSRQDVPIKNEVLLKTGQPPLASQEAGVVGSDKENPSKIAYLSLLGIIILGVLGIYASPKRNDIT
ncbi:MAG: lamin tail domain-containing protein [Candidatus Pacebacteria bacterium]|nr:lamin tail domain-containing protein [Candidatus Paceibacterota bacterium]